MKGSLLYGNYVRTGKYENDDEPERRCNNMEHQAIDFKEIRELAARFSPDEIEGCIMQQMEEGRNVCDLAGPTEFVINELSKASFVREQIDKGMSLMDAVRELARRIRNVQKGFEETVKEA